MRFLIPLALIPCLAGCMMPPRPTPTPTPHSPPASAFGGGEAIAAAPTPGAVPAPPGQATADWRQVVNQGDFQRLMGLDEAWAQALRPMGPSQQAELARLGALVEPGRPTDAGVTPSPALDRPQPPPGDYRCRTIKFGGERTLPLIVYGWFRCRVELTPGGDLLLTKLTGSQRPAGKLYPQDDRRLVFVGAVAWGATESAAPAYGQNPERDQVGYLERIGAERWRLLLPFPKQESVLDIIELVPA
jgi:hypothetical protein